MSDRKDINLANETSSEGVRHYWIPNLKKHLQLDGLFADPSSMLYQLDTSPTSMVHLLIYLAS